MEDIALINRTAEILGQAGSGVIADYTTWHIASAIAWICGGIGAVIWAYKYFPTSEDIDYKPILAVLRVIVIMLGVAVILGNSSDLVAPKAIATHQLIKDIRGQ